MDAYYRLARRLGRPAARTLSVAVAAALLVAAPACAQEGGEEEGQQGQQQQQQQQARQQQFQEMQQLQRQIQQIQQRLSQVQQQAMQDSAIRRARIDLEQSIRAAMAQVNPDVTKMEDSLNVLQQKMNEARQNQDTATIRSVMEAGRPLSQQWRRLQDSVMQRDSLQQMVEAYNQRLQDAMAAINDSVPALIQRRDSLRQVMQSRVQEMRGGGMPGGGQGGGQQGGGQQGGGGGGGGGGQR